MINDLDVNILPLQPFELYSVNHQIHSDHHLDFDSGCRKPRVSSQCLLLKKKIRHKQTRPSLLKIEEGVRNVKLYNLIPSQTNLENLEVIQKVIHLDNN